MRRSGTRLLTLSNGNSYTISELSKMSGISTGGLYHRIDNLNMSADEAISIPLEEVKRNKKIVETDEKRFENTKTKYNTKNYTLREKLKEIMSKPINPKKDAYLELSIKAKSKNWNMRKEVKG